MGFYIPKKTPTLLAILGLAITCLPLFLDSNFSNIIIASGLAFLFLAWVVANLKKGFKSPEEARQQKRVFIGMSLCMVTGLLMLTYYELQMPKYHIARINKELYKIPPQLSKKQLIELGRECNTYGNTLCSHDVFAKIVSLDPRDYESLANLAMAQSHLGFHEYAVINFQRAVKSGVKAYDVYKFYGNSLKVLKKYPQAIKAYQASLTLNPNQASLLKKIKNLQKETEESQSLQTAN